MAPLSWLTLFLIFTLIFICFNCVNYFSFLYKVKSKKIEKETSKHTWKW